MSNINKTNKKLMKAVAILLTLVLLTSSIVSGTLAKFVVSKDASVGMKLKKFGVELEMTYKSDWATNGKTVIITPTKTGDSMSVTISGLRMIPGDDFPEIVRFKFVDSKKPNTGITVTITQTLVHNKETFRIESKVEEGDPNVGNLKVDKYAMPLGFKFAAYNNSGTEVIPMGYVVDPWRLGAASDDDHMNKTLPQNLDAKFGDGVNYAENATKVTATFSSGADVKFKAKDSNTANINQLAFGVEWPETWNGTDYNNADHLRTGATALDYNAMETWLCSQNRNLAVSITYTVKIEQT